MDVDLVQLYAERPMEVGQISSRTSELKSKSSYPANETFLVYVSQYLNSNCSMDIVFMSERDCFQSNQGPDRCAAGAASIEQINQGKIICLWCSVR